MKTVIRWPLAVLLVLSGCASNTGVVAIGENSYMLAKQQSTGFPGLGNMKAEIITEGRMFCSSQSKEFQLVSSSETQPPYVFGNYPRAEIQFLCVTKR